jgi:mRNA interferase RelE/StbE
MVPDLIQVKISQWALKEIKNLPPEIGDRVIGALERLQEDPAGQVFRLKDSRFYSPHVGDYRIVVDIIHRKLLILVVRAGHRKNIHNRI